MNSLESKNSPQSSLLWFFFKNDNFGLKMKILNILRIQPSFYACNWFGAAWAEFVKLFKWNMVSKISISIFQALKSDKFKRSFENQSKIIYTHRIQKLIEILAFQIKLKIRYRHGQSAHAKWNVWQMVWYMVFVTMWHRVLKWFCLKSYKIKHTFAPSLRLYILFS